MKTVHYFRDENHNYWKVKNPKKKGLKFDIVTITHYGEKEILHGFDLPENLRSDYDFLDDDEFYSSQFIEHNGEFRFFGGFMRQEFFGFDGVQGDSYFSGDMVKFSNFGDSVFFARFSC